MYMYYRTHTLRVFCLEKPRHLFYCFQTRRMCFSSVMMPATKHITQRWALQDLLHNIIFHYKCCENVFCFVHFFQQKIHYHNMLLVHWQHSCRDHSMYGLSQRETMLHCKFVSHWLSPYTEWSSSVNTQAASCVTQAHGIQIISNATFQKVWILKGIFFLWKCLIEASLSHWLLITPNDSV